MSTLVVPDHLRSWDVPWPDYRPYDIGLLWGAPDEPDSPDLVRDWPARQASALIPYQLDAHGRPLNPAGRTGVVGRNCRRWGENACADAVVVAIEDGQIYLLLIRRDDCGRIALPGGHVDPGETGIDAARRELLEETALDLRSVTPVVLGRRHVADPRQTDHAWFATTLVAYVIDRRLPAVGADDATEALWMPFPSVRGLIARLYASRRGVLYEAHRPLLELVEGHLKQIGVMH